MRKAAAGQAPGWLQTPGALHGPGGSQPRLVVPAAPRPPRPEPGAASLVTGCVLAGRVCWGCSGGWESLGNAAGRGLARWWPWARTRTGVWGGCRSGTPAGAAGGGGAGERSCSFSTSAHLCTPARTPACPAAVAAAGTGVCPSVTPGRAGAGSAVASAEQGRDDAGCVSSAGGAPLVSGGAPPTHPGSAGRGCTAPRPRPWFVPLQQGCGSRGVPRAAGRAAGDPATSSAETAINKHGPYGSHFLSRTAPVLCRSCRGSQGLGRAADATSAPHCSVCRTSPVRCAPTIRLIAQTSFPRAAEPVRGRVLIPHTGDNPAGHGWSGSSGCQQPVPAASSSVQGHPVLRRAPRVCPGAGIPRSSGEPSLHPSER